MSFLKLARNPKLTNSSKNLVRFSSRLSEDSSEVVSKTRRSRNVDVLPLNRTKSSIFEYPRSRFLNKISAHSRSVTSMRYFSTKSDGTDDMPPEEEPYNPQLPATVAVPEV